jgi:hypothetical protein
VSGEYGFGIALPEGYVAVDYDADGTWVLEIIGEFDQPTARISAEPLPEDVVDVGGFWQLMKDRDPLMKRSITYEMVSMVDDSPAVLARIERIEAGDYILAITWVFVHDAHGFTLSGYPAAGKDFNTARDIALQVRDQFRWMTEEEIAAFEEQELVIPEGEEF